MSTPDDLVVAAVEEVVAVYAQDAERIAAFRRRFLLALHDMGWLEALGRDWIKIGEGGLEFSPVDFKRADIILRDLGLERIG